MKIVSNTNLSSIHGYLMVYYFLLLESISLDEHGAKNMEANLEQ